MKVKKAENEGKKKGKISMKKDEKILPPTSERSQVVFPPVVLIDAFSLPFPISLIAWGFFFIELERDVMFFRMTKRRDDERTDL